MIVTYTKAYRQTNRERIAARTKAYYPANKAKPSTRRPRG